MSETGSSHRPSSSPGSSLGSATNRVNPALPAAGASSLDDDQTVITSRSDLSNVSVLQPFQLGQMLEGERLGQFVLQQFVGGGGMGAVFRALDTTLNREVAVKVLPKGQAGDEETLRRFRNEAQSAARLNHDNIARVHYVGEDRGVHYIVFEFIDGVNLRDLVEQRGPLTLAEAVSYTLQVSEALAHASERDVIHRDIKPSNVLITPGGKAKLVDMGLARLHQVEPTNDLTASGVTLGTFDYISPEQARDPRSADVRSDLYSLGCSFYYMLTGRPPFPVGTVLQKLLQHQGDEPPDVRGFRPELSDEVCRILAKMLAKNPTDRFQTPAELIADLVPLAEQMGVPHSSRSATAWVAAPRPLPPWVRHLPWMVPLAALILIVIGLDFKWSIDSPTVEPTYQPSPPAKAPAVAPVAALNKSAKGGTKAAPGGGKPPTPPAAANPIVSVEPGDPGRAAALSGVTLGSELPGAALQIEPLSGGISVDQPTPAGIPAPGNHGKDAGGGAGTDVALSQPQSDAEAGLLIVSDTGEDNTYSSLQAACSAAKSGETIELRYTGRREERAISLANVKLTIRAAEGFSPVVVFRPNDPSPVLCPRSMITLAGGELRTSGVSWELYVPLKVPADNWSLFETRRAELLRCENCVLTISNAALGQGSYHPSVAFVDVQAAPGANGVESAAGDSADNADQPVVIELNNCVARGEATFVRSSELQALRLVWHNGLLASSERLLSVSGGATMPRHPGRIEVDLRHLTAIVRSGLVLVSSGEDGRYQLPLEIRCVDSIASASGSGTPLIEQTGVDGVEEFQALLQWSGDHNFYDGFEDFWKILKTTSPQAVRQLSFRQWKSFWKGSENQPSSEAILWKELPEADRPFYAQSKEDYALSPRSGNGAVDGGSDGLDAGFLAEQLPADAVVDRLPKHASR